jgi:hypothetical protein
MALLKSLDKSDDEEDEEGSEASSEADVDPNQEYFGHVPLVFDDFAGLDDL